MTVVVDGITEAICLVRCKGRFGRPTSGGWADIMLNFHFEDDAEWTHVCEIQLVHAELYSVRKNMGAHGSYTEFRAALELCEKVGVDPEEEGSDAGILDALAWTAPGQQQKTHPSEMPTASSSASPVAARWKAARSTPLVTAECTHTKSHSKTGGCPLPISSAKKADLAKASITKWKVLKTAVCKPLLVLLD